MFLFEEAKQYVLEIFPYLIEEHQNVRFDGLEKGFDEYDERLPRDAGVEWDNFHIALNFWDAWIDAKNHNWLYYESLTIDDWPKLAKEILEAVEKNQKITSKQIQENFGLKKN